MLRVLGSINGLQDGSLIIINNAGMSYSEPGGGVNEVFQNVHIKMIQVAICHN